MKRWPEKIVVVGEPARGLTNLLITGLSNQGVGTVTAIDVYAFENDRLSDLMPDLLFFAIDQESLFQPEDGPLHVSEPIPIVRSMWNALAGRFGIPIHVAIPQRSDSFNGFSALDALAFLLSGAAGVWELGIPFLVPKIISMSYRS